MRLWRYMVAVVWGLILCLSSYPFANTAVASSTTENVVISEIRLGGSALINPAGGTVQEYVELYNAGTAPADLSGWKLEYAKSTFSSAYCGLLSWQGLVPDSQIIELSGSLTSSSVSSPIVRQLNDSGWGALRLIDDSGGLQDMVGWGSAVCYETTPATTPSSGSSLQRFLDCDLTPKDSGVNNDDFSVGTPSPAILSEIYAQSCQAEEETPSIPPESNCEGIVISEILPNPSGSDTGKEFIELQNSTPNSINLKNCKLAISTSSATYVFPDSVLAAGSHVAVYDGTSGITLPNSSAATVWLLAHDNTELAELTYPDGMEDDLSYSLISGSFVKSYSPTPNKENIHQSTKPCPPGQYRSAETSRCNSLAVVSTGLKPCNADQVRNPLTNRCRKNTSFAFSLKPCRADQLRNPQTNRCKNRSSVTVGLKPCKAGQQRNPETNRCKKIGSESGLKPCKKDQERNPETNRCRKKSASASGFATITDLPAASISKNISWMFAGVSVVGALGYGVFEWRREILIGLSAVKTKFTISS